MVWGHGMDLKCDFIDQNFLQICRDRTVLEVGCFEGWITERILNHNPRHLVLLESHKRSVDYVVEKFPQATVIHGDMHEYADLKQIGPVDVALVLGVIYHSHAPLYALEVLVNCCDPQAVILDNMNPRFEWCEEPSNEQGMRCTVNRQKTCNIVMNIDNEITIKAMNNLGYQLIRQETYPADAQGAGRPIFQFEKI